MEIRYAKPFTKRFKKSPVKIQKATLLRLAMFSLNPYDLRLNNHILSGKWSGYRSINITGDWRAIFRETETGVYFIAFGTHSQLYG